MKLFEALEILKNDDDINYITESSIIGDITTITFTPPSNFPYNKDDFTHLMYCKVRNKGDEDDYNHPIIHGEFFPDFAFLVSENWKVNQPNSYSYFSTIEDYKAWRAQKDKENEKVETSDKHEEHEALEGLAKLFKELDKYTLEETDFDTAFSVITELINELKR